MHVWLGGGETLRLVFLHRLPNTKTGTETETNTKTKLKPKLNIHKYTQTYRKEYLTFLSADAGMTRTVRIFVDESSPLSVGRPDAAVPQDLEIEGVGITPQVGGCVGVSVSTGVCVCVFGGVYGWVDSDLDYPTSTPPQLRRASSMLPLMP